MKKNQLKQSPKKVKASKVNKTRNSVTNANEKWNETMDNNLEVLLFRKVSVKDLSSIFGRTSNAIRKRIYKLNLKAKLKDKLELFVTVMIILRNEFSDLFINII